MLNSTPLSTSTLRQDIINKPAVVNNSPLIKAEEANLANLHINSGKLKDLQAEIEQETSELGSLKDAINKSEQISFRLVKILNAYETRMAALESIVMPVYRNILNMSQTNDRIEGTIDLVEYLIKINEQVRKEVVILLPGPTLDNLTVYLDSIGRLEMIHKDLISSDLAYCKISIEKAKSAIDEAHSKLQLAFKNWLNDDSNTTDTDIAILNPEIISALQRIVEFSLSSPNMFSTLISDWIETRSNYLAATCESQFVLAQTFEKDSGSYKRGSHPLPAAYDLARRLLEVEEALMGKVWPGTAAGPTFLRSAQIVRDLAVSTVEVICAKMKKALTRREYADQVFLFQVIGACYRAVYPSKNSNDPAFGNSDSFAVQVLLPSLKFFITSTASLLIDLIGEIRGTIPRALERPFTVPQNATVFELTSITVNVLKRIESDGPVLEALLRGQATDNWDGTLIFAGEGNVYTGVVGDAEVSENTANTPHISLTNTKRYFTDLLSSLETSIDTKSKTLRRPMQTLLFQLNNYNYLGRNLVGIRAELIDVGLLKRYEQIIETLQRSFVSSWTSIANLISTTTSTGSSSRTASKDKLKAFTLEFDEATRIQSACSVPDVELKTSLRSKVKDTCVPPYILFYNQNQALFTGSLASSAVSSSKYHDPDQVEDMINHLFEG